MPERDGGALYRISNRGIQRAMIRSMQPLMRVIDANANRAREGLRVLEDAARFCLEDVQLTTQAKTLRHRVTEVVRLLGPSNLLDSRDTPGDVGTAVATESESTRHGHRSVVAASGKRVGEALRSIEEAAKVTRPGLAPELERIRYAVYELEQSVLLGLTGTIPADWSVCLLLTESACRKPWEHVIAGAIEGGVDCIQVREKSMSMKQLAERTTAVIDIARPAGVEVIVNDHVDVAIATGADGVHLGQDDLSPASARSICGHSLLIGSSTHSLEEAADAVGQDVDYIGVGCMFSSRLKPGLQASSTPLLEELVRAHPDLPHLAIGGICRDNIEEVINAGGRAVAVCHGICDAEDPAGAAAHLSEAIHAARLEQESS